MPVTARVETQPSKAHILQKRPQLRERAWLERRLPSRGHTDMQVTLDKSAPPDTLVETPWSVNSTGVSVLAVL